MVVAFSRNGREEKCISDIGGKITRRTKSSVSE
jgi:hypothetical protein